MRVWIKFRGFAAFLVHSEMFWGNACPIVMTTSVLMVMRCFVAILVQMVRCRIAISVQMARCYVAIFFSPNGEKFWRNIGPNGDDRFCGNMCPNDGILDGKYLSK